MHRWGNGCGCDTGDSVFLTGSRDVFIGGCVIAFGESNIENHASVNVTVDGNFLLNPLGPNPHGNQVQTWGDDGPCMKSKGGGADSCNSRDTRIRFNVALTCTLPVCDPQSFPYSPGTWRGSRIVNRTEAYGGKNYTVQSFEAPQTWDAVSFGLTTNALSEGNLVMGGDSGSGCGMIADVEPHYINMTNNVLDHTGQAGIGIAGGDHITVVGNTAYNNHSKSLHRMLHECAPC